MVLTHPMLNPMMTNNSLHIHTYTNSPIDDESTRHYVECFFALIGPFIFTSYTNNCKKNHILVNSITEPANGSMSVQAKILKQDYAVSISTFGKSPGFSKALREYFENILTPDFDLALKVYLDIRSEILATVDDANQRAEFLHKLELNKIKNFVSEKDDIPYDELLKKVKEWQSY